MSWSVYMLRCSDDTLYCGITTCLERRVAEHNTSPDKAAKYTWARRPVALVWYEDFPDRRAASQREYQVKRLSRKDKQRLIHTKSEESVRFALD